MKEEQNEWKKRTHPLINTSQQQEEHGEVVSKKTSKKPPTQREAGWLGNKDKKKNKSSVTPTKNQTGQDYSHITLLRVKRHDPSKKMT